MASERGGYKRPTNPSSYSGVGKNAKRTDGRQAIKSPNVQDSTDLQVNDRERIIQGQRVAPLSETPSPRLAAPTSGSATPGGQGAVLPPLDIPTTRPGEPVTEGLAFGPGAGPEAVLAPEPTDEMDVVLQAMVELTGDASIAQMLDDHREFKSWRATRSSPAPMQPMTPDLATEGGLAGEEVLELSVETPATSSDLPAEGGEEIVDTGLLPQTPSGDPEMV